MRIASLATITALAAAPASAEIITQSSAKSVAETIDALSAAVEGAGATVFARVNHGKGAEMVEMELGDAELLIFGNPKLGTPALQADIHAGLLLPLRVLAYADGDGQVWLVYEDPVDMLDGLVPADAPVIGAMAGALAKLTGAALQ